MREIGAVCGDATHWGVSRFKESNFDLNDEENPSCLVKLGEDGLKKLLRENAPQSTRELDEQLMRGVKTAMNHHSMGKVAKFGSWVL